MLSCDLRKMSLIRRVVSVALSRTPTTSMGKVVACAYRFQTCFLVFIYSLLLLPPVLTDLIMALELVLRAGFPQRDVNWLSCSLSCSLGLTALSHHGTIILELDVYKNFNIRKIGEI